MHISLKKKRISLRKIMQISHSQHM